MSYIVIIVCLTFSALFSGLTLGLMGLDVHTLKRKARLGDKRASAIYPLRVKGNQLLTTLLLGNVAVNAILAVFLGSIASGLTATLVATGLIFIFGEIFPQAVISRFAMTFGARLAPFVGMLMRITSIVTYPIAWSLDKMLGEELPEIHTKRELMEIISEHEDSEVSTIDREEERIIHGALQFSHKTAKDAMTSKEKVVWFAEDVKLDLELRKRIALEGYSRYPILDSKDDVVLGVLFVKDILVADEQATAAQVCEKGFLYAHQNKRLDSILQGMLAHHFHMAIVHDDSKSFVGVLTLEDILEEVIQQEIFDEGDE